MDADATQKDRDSPVQWGPLLVLDAMGLQKLDPRERDAYQALVPGLPPLSFQKLIGGGSFNAPQVNAMILLWCGTPARVQEARDWLAQLDSWQLGHAEPPAGQELLRFFGGSEQFSPTYWPWRWMVDAAASVWAQQHGDSALAALTWEALHVHAALAALLAVPALERKLQSNNQGQLFQNTDYVSPVGERGNEGHLLSDTCLQLAELTRRPYVLKRTPDPAVVIVRGAVAAAQAAGASLPSYAPGGLGTGWTVDPNVLAALSRIRIRGTQHVLWWDGVRVVYLPLRLNTNTPAILGERFDVAKEAAEHLFPFPPGRDFAMPGGTCQIEGSQLVATGPTGSPALTLPAGSPRLSILLGPDGITA